MADTITIQITATRDDPDANPAYDTLVAVAEAYAVQALADGGFTREQITYTHSVNDEAGGSGDGTDFAEVTLLEPES